MLGDWTSRPTIRARDVDREYAMGLLRNASVDGQLTTAEFEQRLAVAMRARTLGELAALIGDLQEAPAVRQALVPYTPTPPRRRGGLGKVMVGGLVFVLLMGGVSQLSNSFSDDGFATTDGVSVSEYDSTELGNPLELGLDPDAAGYLERLGMPSDLPIPVGAGFDGHNWQSAGTDKETGETTYRWHLEYLVPDNGQPAEPSHVAEFYRDHLDAAAFGTYDQRALPEGEGIEMVWPGGPDREVLAVRTRYTAKGSIRVVLDLTAVRPAEPRADVAGELGNALRKADIPTTQGMSYLQSRVSQLETDPSRCTLEQVWSATPEQYAKIRTEVDSADVRIVELANGKQLTYSAAADCAALAF